MKYFLMIGTILLLLISGDGFAKAHKPDSDAHSTCVYNYMACRDKCDYYQDSSQITPCKARCDRSYGCRPSKVEMKADPTKDPS